MEILTPSQVVSELNRLVAESAKGVEAFAGSKGASRQEMEKVARDVTPPKVRDWEKDASDLEWTSNVDGLRKLYADAKLAKADKVTLDKIRDAGERAAKAQSSAGSNS